MLTVLNGWKSRRKCKLLSLDFFYTSQALQAQKAVDNIFEKFWWVRSVGYHVHIGSLRKAVAEGQLKVTEELKRGLQHRPVSVI